MSYDKSDFEWRIVQSGDGKTPDIRTNSASWVYNDFMWIICGSGAGHGKFSEVWRLSMATKLWEKMKCIGDPPSNREGHSWTYIGDSKVIIFGGQGFSSPNQKLAKVSELSRVITHSKREVFNDLFQFDCETCTWNPIYPDGLTFPMGRRGHTAIYISKPASSIGHNGSNNSVADTYSAAGSSYYTASSASNAGKVSFQSNTDSSVKFDTIIPNNSILVYGGSGIELSKYTEQIYNDVWSFCFDTNLWTRHEVKGAEARPCFDHRVERVGENMIIIGGITGPLKTLAQLQNLDMISDVMILNLRNLSWSYLKLWDNRRKPAKFNFHGFSMASDIRVNPNILYIFGGREVIDGKSATLARPTPSNPSYATKNTFILNLLDGYITPLKLKEESSLCLENRYGHVNCSASSIDSILTSYENNSQKLRREKKKKSLYRGEKTPHKIEPIIYVFGGSNIERGGFCDPVLYALFRIQSSLDNPYVPNLSGEKDLDLISINSRPASRAGEVSFGSRPVSRGSRGGGGHSRSPSRPVSRAGNSPSRPGSRAGNSPSRPISRGNMSPINSRPASRGMSPHNSPSRPGSRGNSPSRPSSRGKTGEIMFMESIEFEDETDSGTVESSLFNEEEIMKSTSIWHNLQVQVHQQYIQSIGKLSSKTLKVDIKQPSNWEELKLALTTPLSQRRFENSSTPSVNGSDNKLRQSQSAPSLSQNRLVLSSTLPKTGGIMKNTGMNRLSESRGSNMKVRISTAFESNESVPNLRPYTTPANMSRQMSRSNNDNNNNLNNSQRFLNTLENNNEDGENNSKPLGSLTPKQIRDMRIKELTDTLLPVIKNKTKVEARNEFRKMFPLYNTIS